MPGADRLEVVDPTGIPDWDERLARHPEATVFHTAAWARVLADTYGYLPSYFTALNEEKLVALLPFMEIRSWLTGTRGVSLPFTDECRPILPAGMPFDEVARDVISRALSRDWKTIEYRGRCRSMGGLTASAEYLTHELDLTETDEALTSRFRPNVQRNIRKAERAGVAVATDVTSSGIREFYRLNCLTRRDHGLPPQPEPFFENLRKHVLEKDLGTLLLARHKGTVIAGAVFLHFGRGAVYKYGASDRHQQDLRANNLVFREAIRTLRGRGFRALSFGRTDIAHEGLRQFKLSWGAREGSLEYFRFDLSSKTWLIRRRTRDNPWDRVISKVPIPVLRLVGGIAYRHIG